MQQQVQRGSPLRSVHQTLTLLQQAVCCCRYYIYQKQKYRRKHDAYIVSNASIFPHIFKTLCLC